ncbi:Glutamate synthase [NADPH] small chain [Rhodovulum sp. PH10]|uniref:glutamate synthase n=1 Tax=Rhodovulum sp. PH10 TaxID=1187851 RepID=UPI00027C24F6|nr:glutamate synthase [Rhodovulum sp. PH10]EJW12299.1 Glutamate synthase [NADPH] small chain [Rhodovulum sp. PH10]
MVDLVPIPLGVLVTRLFRELAQKHSAFDLPEKFFVQPPPGRDIGTSFQGRRIATPFGPAAGPHTQMAQNIVSSWLAGGRVIELKTVQIKDRLALSRPCIDVATVGFNVEWSQELTLEQSHEEYVKAAMLIEMLKAAGVVSGLDETVFDMSVGYDLEGIRSPRVRGFMAGMMDASATIDRLRAEIPDAWAAYRDLPYPKKLSDTLTLSTFHGCPPDEIEAIAAFLIEEIGLDVIVKLNPTLLGREALTELLHGKLGYTEIEVPDSAFDKDASWHQVTAFVDRLGRLAERHGKKFGVKFSNTLVVRNHKTFFSAAEEVMYLSGPPLHPIAITLVDRFRKEFGDRFPISFSAGIDEGNFADTVALGVQPVTVCTNFLRPGGYRRGSRYVASLATRMAAVGAADIDTFVIRSFGNAETTLKSLALAPDREAACLAALAGDGDLRAAAAESFPAWLSAAKLANTAAYAAVVATNPRYHADENATPPKKVGSNLVLFDCLACDKCIPVCPNDANFSFVIPKGETPIERLVQTCGAWLTEPTGTLVIQKPRQIGTYADACNECGTCDVLCPEDGGPYLVKPMFFGSIEAFEAAPQRDGFVLEKTSAGVRMHGRFKGRVVRLETRTLASRVRYAGEGFDLELDPSDPAGTVEGTAEGTVDLGYLRIMEKILAAVTAPQTVNFVSAGLEQSAPGA